MLKQATKKLSHGVPVSTPTKHEKPTTTENNKINLGKQKKSEPSECNSDASDDLDPVIMSEQKKIFTCPISFNHHDRWRINR